VDPRVSVHKPFGTVEVAAFRQKYPWVQVLHRVNECDQRKDSDFMDELLAEANQLADHTTFISQWVRDYHAQRWFDATASHDVIYNGADNRVFHPLPPRRRGSKLRLVTHHWSDNWLKGFDVYQQVDALISDGMLPDVELWIIGRWPQEIRWRAARTFAPTHGPALAALLRECDAYLTGSRFEPCGMHHVEGAQCGLPLLFHEDGGGIVEAGRRYGIGFSDDPAPAIGEMQQHLGEYRKRLLREMPSGERMATAYADIVQRLAVRAQEQRAAAI
jgi:glycosyltransferase involved in cell wall biosynthesis